ncbi:MAG: DUF5522 domain-containing protein [Terracidiphilus sp.]|jgi:hypothetical protein
MDRTEPAAVSRLESEDYYFEGDLMVFTAAYHLKRGSCCKSGCRHCPYGFRGQPTHNSEPGCTDKKSK